MFACVLLLLHSHLTFEQAIPAAPAAVLTAQGEVEVRCFSPRMQPWLTRLLVLQVSAMHAAVQAWKVRVCAAVCLCAVCMQRAVLHAPRVTLQPHVAYT